MKFPALSGSGEGYAVLLGVGALVFVGLFLFLKKQTADAAAALANVNAGTPYAGAGVVGTLGNATNQVLGGAPAAVGEGIGSWLADWLNPGAPAPDGSYQVTNADGSVSTVQAPVLQTRKQAVSDNYFDSGALQP